ncbi:Vacuolar calcium ion transporter [Lachnellula suecica]|uniref:Vacuolar calcium ion transporter n=1 Tax=Lachnellula suecica TaxID=602035 RepID=A0A8T9CGN8_9HELO|nr:Vacuolar calcium ion transporter [Lachnellula suecica]
MARSNWLQEHATSHAGAPSRSNNVPDGISSDHPPPAPPPQADGEGAIVNADTPKKKNVLLRFWHTGKTIILSSYINWLLVFVPVGIAAKAANLSPGIIFGMNAIAIVPLAGLLSHATESVAKRMGDTIGALMNVTFGNAVELIILYAHPGSKLPQSLLTPSSIIALSKNEIRIVQASLLGSILANLLLILGMCFLLGGLRYQEQIYNSTVTQMSACLLSLSVMSLLLPTAFHASFSTDVAAKATKMVLKVSRGTSVVLLIVYGMYLLFQLKSHAYMYESTPQHIIDEESAPGPVAQWMESSDDSSSSSSDSDSDGSSGSNTTAKRVKRLMRGHRRRRKSSAGSKDTAEAGTRPASLGTSSITPVHTDHLTEEPQSMGVTSANHDFAEDADDEHKARSRRNSHGSLIFSRKERKREKERKRQEKKDRKRALRNGDTITEGVVENTVNEKTEIVDDLHNPRRVDFAIANDIPLQPIDSPQKRASALRSLNLRPQIPKTFSQNVFTQPAPSQSPAPAAGRVPRVRYGIRRTNSLPDRLNQSFPGPTRAGSSGVQPPHVNSLPIAGDVEKKEDEENISRTTAVFLLLISTGLVAICAEFMVDSINAVVAQQSGLSEAFIGLIILPIVGNAAEHVTAVTVATKNKMDLAIGVAVGSSIQIVLDGRSNYLEGALLCSAYVIIAVAAFFYPNPDEQSNLGGNAEAGSKMIRDLVGSVIGL